MTELTDEQLNIAICEWRGWKQVALGGWKNPNGKQVHCSQGKLPNHLTGISSLGHMHEAEKRLTDLQYAQFTRELRLLTKPEGFGDYVFQAVFKHERDYLSATARQRAIALLHVVKPELFQ